MRFNFPINQEAPSTNGHNNETVNIENSNQAAALLASLHSALRPYPDALAAVDGILAQLLGAQTTALNQSTAPTRTTDNH